MCPAINDVLRAVRKSHGFEQEPWAKTLHVTRSLIARYESGTAKPSLVYVLKTISLARNVSDRKHLIAYIAIRWKIKTEDLLLAFPASLNMQSSLAVQEVQAPTDEPAAPARQSSLSTAGEAGSTFHALFPSIRPGLGEDAGSGNPKQQINTESEVSDDER
jgi:DNA-binding XRE family transcriptional regulator